MEFKICCPWPIFSPPAWIAAIISLTRIPTHTLFTQTLSTSAREGDCSVCPFFTSITHISSEVFKRPFYLSHKAASAKPCPPALSLESWRRPSLWSPSKSIILGVPLQDSCGPNRSPDGWVESHSSREGDNCLTCCPVQFPFPGVHDLLHMYTPVLSSQPP